MKLSTFPAMVAFALEREDNAGKLYQEAAENPEYSRAEETFLKLSKENSRQKSAVQRIYADNIAGDGDVGSFSPVVGLDRDGYLSYSKSLPNMGYRDFIDFAIVMEDESSRLYHDIAGQVDSMGTRVVRGFEALSKEKANRKLVLQALAGSKVRG